MRRLLFAALLAALAVPAQAQAGFFPAEIIDGPNADVVAVGDVDLSRDGTGGVVYVKRDGGVDHVFLSRFTDGAFAAPERLDPNLPGPSSQPVIGVADGGRMAIAFVNGGAVYTMTKALGQDALSPAAAVAGPGASNPSIDMSINGSSYVTFTQNGDVKGARAERDSATFTVLNAPLDIAPGRRAGVGERNRSRVVTSADGSALAVWGEEYEDGTTHVHARRMFELRLSQVPSDLGAGTDTPEVDIEDDSSFAQVTFRRQDGSGSHTFMRRLRGSAFEDPAAVDNGAQSVQARVDLTGRGEGLVAHSGAGNDVGASTIWDNNLNSFTALAGGNAVSPLAVSAIGENEDGTVAWIQGTNAGDASVRAIGFDGVEKLALIPEATLSRPELGPVDPEAGLDAAASRAGDVAVVFVQGAPSGRHLVAGFFDKPPSRVNGFNSERLRNAEQLRWPAALNLFGPPTYRIEVDGRTIGETTDTTFTPKPKIRDGRHRWQIFIRDRRGQEVRSRTRRLLVDNTPPVLRVAFNRSGRTLTVRARAADRRGRRRSGLHKIEVDFGNKRWVRLRGSRTRRYSRGGTYTVRVRAIDKAGSVRTQTRRVRVG